jgi:hypothetical protein
MLYSSEPKSQMRAYVPPRNTAFSPNLLAQNAHHPVYVSACTNSLSARSILPALFINLMTKGLLIWGHHNTGQQKKKKKMNPRDKMFHTYLIVLFLLRDTVIK